jgi:hypothetical protein
MQRLLKRPGKFKSEWILLVKVSIVGTTILGFDSERCYKEFLRSPDPGSHLEGRSTWSSSRSAPCFGKPGKDIRFTFSFYETLKKLAAQFKRDLHIYTVIQYC